VITRLIAGILAVLAVTALLVYIRNMQHGPAPRRRRSGGGGMGWALIFLMSGRMPPPPPASQIEVELNGEKDRAASDLLRKP